MEFLIEYLEDENPEIRHRAAEVLGEIGDERAVDPLINTLRDKNSGVQWRAKEALIKLGEPSVLPLIKILDDKDPAIRRKAACALADIGDKRAISPLIKILKMKTRSTSKNQLITE